MITYKVYSAYGFINLRTCNEENVLEEVQAAVGGLVEVVQRENVVVAPIANVKDDHIFIVNEEGLFVPNKMRNPYFPNLFGTVVVMKSEDFK
tara:strand:+ start:17451 stop:17726 length:276 start_codon:yes stop_codon:yes gene_type:complete